MTDAAPTLPDGARARDRSIGAPPGYHAPVALDAAIDVAAARAGTRAEVETIGESVAHRPIRAITVAAPGQTPDPHRPQALVTANIHGVEVISSEVALGVLDRLCAPAPEGPAAAALAAADVTVVPVANPDGRSRALASLARRRWWNGAPRTNARGVDLNRNWPWPEGASAHWLPIAGTDLSFLPWFRGPSPLSEPETAALADLCDAARPYAAVHLHSVGQLVTHPWSWRADPPADAGRFHAFVDAIRAAQPHWRYRSKQSHAWYPIVGGLNDWLYERYGTLSVTVEVSTPAEALRRDPLRARWWFWAANPIDPAPHVENDAPAVLAGLAAAAPR